MGCDIHMYPEKKNAYGWSFVWRAAPDEYWKDQYPPPDRANYFAWADRWYWLFGQLAGVRRNGPPIAEPRGIPQDVSHEVAEEMEDADYHTHSWLTLAELQAHPWETAPQDGPIGPDAIKSIRDWLARLAEIDPDPNNVRVVFAFDN